MFNLSAWGATSRQPIPAILETFEDLSGIIKFAKFHIGQSRGFRAAGSRKVVQIFA
jgi:hypothetical protein